MNAVAKRLSRPARGARRRFTVILDVNLLPGSRITVLLALS